MTTLLSLPNEILLAITTDLVEIPDLHALVLANRRLRSVAQSALYAAAARTHKATRSALFYAAENGFLESVRTLLAHGASPNVVYISPIPWDSLHRVLAHQGRRRGRQPLIDRTLVLEFIKVILRRPSEMLYSRCCRRLQYSLFGEPNDIRDLAESKCYNWLINMLHGTHTPSDCNTTVDLPDAGTPDDPPPDLGPKFDDFFTWTALHVAARRGDDDLAELLLNSGAALGPLSRITQHPDILGASKGAAGEHLLLPCLEAPLCLAICSGHSSTAELLLRRGAPTIATSGRVTALHVAAWHGDSKLCRVLMDKNPDLLGKRTHAGLLPFHYAAAAGHLQTVGRHLSDNGVDVRSAYGLYWPPDSFFHSVDHRTVFTQALLTKKYSVATALLDLNPDFAAPRGDELEPAVACLEAPSLWQEDEEQMVPIFRRLLLSGRHTCPEVPEHLLLSASGNHLHQIVEVLLKSFPDSVIRNSGIDKAMNAALAGARSGAVASVKALVDSGITARGMQTPGLSRVFGHVGDIDGRPNLANLCLRVPGILEATLEIARLFHEHLARRPQGVEQQDLHLALIGACQPGGLKACEWLSSLGALRCVDKVDLAVMLSRTALPANAGGCDMELAEWVLSKADGMGCKSWVLNNCDVPRMIMVSGKCTIAKQLISQGATLDSPRRQGEPRYRTPGDSFPFPFQCHSRQLQDQPDFVEAQQNVLFMVCSKPDMQGAVDLLRLAVAVAGEDARRLVNCTLSRRFIGRRRILTPASLLCFTEQTERSGDKPTSEQTRLAMLRILLDAGAEVHALVECTSQDMESASGAKDDELPRASVWHALSLQRMGQESQREETPVELSGDLPNTVVRWRDNPVRRAIRSWMPSLVQAILEARPLPKRNDPTALLYLRTACGGSTSVPFDRLSPQVLEVVLNTTNLEHADLPLHSKGYTALLTLMRFFQVDDSDRRIPSAEALNPRHECRCEDELISFESDHLSRMVGLLLARGARWNTKSQKNGRSALGELRTLLRRDTRFKSVYKQHNIAEFRKHLVLDIYVESAANAPDFNPFEMGTVKATHGELLEGSPVPGFSAL